MNENTTEYVNRRLEERNKDNGDQRRKWKRDTSTDDEYAYDEISPFGLSALARVCREGFKHGKGNWRDHPQPEGVVLNHVINHLAMYMKGDRSEDHLAKVAWGMFALIHYRDCPSTAHKEPSLCKAPTPPDTP